MFNLKNIIVPTDFSKLSASAFGYAKDLAETMDATIHLIYVLEKTPPFLTSRSTEVTEEEMMKSAEEKSRFQLKEIAEEVRDDSSIKIIEVLRKGIDYEEIIKYSKEVNSDMIVIATHGRTGVFHTLLGSVAEKVIRYSKCPVLVISPQEEEQFSHR
jgi:nucleotide-binding universal stress UspA family protein